jgi:hypothetical protein
MPVTATSFSYDWTLFKIIKSYFTAAVLLTTAQEDIILSNIPKRITMVHKNRLFTKNQLISTSNNASHNKDKVLLLLPFQLDIISCFSSSPLHLDYKSSTCSSSTVNYGY